MGRLKTAGTPLAGTGLLDQHHIQKLKALSVTTVEELLGIIAANPHAMSQFLEGTSLPHLQSAAAGRAQAVLMQTQAELRAVEFPTGARQPVGLPVEREVSRATFERFRTMPVLAPAAPGPSTTMKDLRPCFGPVRDQDPRGTCVAFACCAVIECVHHRNTGKLNDYSEQWLYWNAKQNDGQPNLAGTWVNVAMPLLKQDGVCLESVWPYNPVQLPNNEGQGPPPAQAAADAAQHKASAFTLLSPTSSAQIRGMLDSDTPVAISIPVFDTWYNNPNTKATGIIEMPPPLSVLVGGHAMCVVGYGYDAEDIDGGWYFILRNSWGTVWAPLSPIEPGYGIIPFKFIDQFGWEAATCQ